MENISRKALNLTAKLDGTVQVAHAAEYVNALCVIEHYIAELEAEIARLSAELRNSAQDLYSLEEQTRWHNIEKEGIPNLNQDVLVTFRDGGIGHGHFYEFYDYSLHRSGGVYFDHHGIESGISVESIEYWHYELLPEERE